MTDVTRSCQACEAGTGIHECGQVRCPDELHGADGGRCPTCGVDPYTAAGVPVPSQDPGVAR